MSSEARDDVRELRRLFFRRFFDNEVLAPNGGGEDKIGLVYAALVVPGFLITAPLLMKFDNRYISAGRRMIIALDDKTAVHHGIDARHGPRGAGRVGRPGARRSGHRHPRLTPADTRHHRSVETRGDRALRRHRGGGAQRPPQHALPGSVPGTTGSRAATVPWTCRHPCRGHHGGGERSASSSSSRAGRLCRSRSRSDCRERSPRGSRAGSSWQRSQRSSSHRARKRRRSGLTPRARVLWLRRRRSGSSAYTRPRPHDW